jgi:hypothetical protein
MSIETDVKTLKEDPNSLYKTQKVRFSSDKSILTPTKTVPLDKLKLMHPLSNRARQLNEIFKRFTAKQIEEANEDSDKYHETEMWFNSQKSKIKPDTVTFCFLDFKEQRIPTNEEIEFLTEVAYCNSDITTIPIISHFNDPKQIQISYENYKNYLESAIQSIGQFNKKPIMGIIPKLAPKKVADLLEFYSKKGINTFALDLGGSNPISSSMRIFKVLKTLNKMKILDSCYLHGHNVGMRVNKIAEVIPAKDILGFGVGLNSLGEKRTEFHPNRAFLSYIQTNPHNKFRLFNKKDYGYWKAISKPELEKVFPNDSTVPISAFNTASQITYWQKVFNFEQLALEAHNVMDVITDDPQKSLEYVKKKKHVVEDDMKVLETGKKKIK